MNTMYRNQYDMTAMIFSPAGRLHQVEYAMEAVKQGSAALGLRNKEFAVLASFNRAASELASYQQKIFKVDDHMAIAISGLIADGRTLYKYMIEECLNHKYVYETPMPIGRLVSMLADKMHYYTQNYGRRPYGVGLLVAGVDQTGPHLYQADPSGNFYEYIAQAMGARSQSSKTFLEREYQTVDDMKLNDLIKLALRSLKGSATEKLTSRNCSIAYVGVNTPFTLLEDEKLKPFVDEVTAGDVDEPAAEPAEAGGGDGDDGGDGGDNGDGGDDEDGESGPRKGKMDLE